MVCKYRGKKVVTSNEENTDHSCVYMAASSLYRTKNSDHLSNVLKTCSEPPSFQHLEMDLRSSQWPIGICVAWHWPPLFAHINAYFSTLLTQTILLHLNLLVAILELQYWVFPLMGLPMGLPMAWSLIYSLSPIVTCAARPFHPPILPSLLNDIYNYLKLSLYLLPTVSQ